MDFRSPARRSVDVQVRPYVGESSGQMLAFTLVFPEGSVELNSWLLMLINATRCERFLATCQPRLSKHNRPLEQGAQASAVTRPKPFW